MITLLLNSVLFLYVFLESIKRKEYRYTASAVMVGLYFVFAILQGNYNLIANSQVFGWVQKIMLVILAGYMVFVMMKSDDRKKNLPAVIVACAACVFRFLRTLVFNLCTSDMQVPGADVQSMYREFYVYYVILDSATKFTLLLVLFWIAWILGKPEATDS